jgi:hypothetical protein
VIAEYENIEAGDADKPPVEMKTETVEEAV